MKTQTEVRQAFWEAHPQYKNEYRKTCRQNQYRTDIRCAFVGFVDILRGDNEITETLANRVTL